MTILAAIQAIQDAMIQITGVKSAPDYPDGGEKPIVLTHLTTGNITPGNPAGARKELNNIMVELHIPDDGGIAGAYASLEAIHPLIVAALCLDTTFGGTLQEYGYISFTTTPSSWDGVSTRARMYTLNNCKIIA